MVPFFDWILKFTSKLSPCEMGLSSFQNSFQKTLESLKAMDNPWSQEKSHFRNVRLKGPRLNVLNRDMISFVGVAHLTRGGRDLVRGGAICRERKGKREIERYRSISLFPFLSLSLSFFVLSLFLHLSFPPLLSLSALYSLSLSLSLSLSVSLFSSFTPSLSLSLSLSLNYFLSLSLSLSVAVSQSLTHICWHTTWHTIVCVFVCVCASWKILLVTGASHQRCQNLSGKRWEASAQGALLHTFYTQTLCMHTRPHRDWHRLSSYRLSHKYVHRWPGRN